MAADRGWAWVVLGASMFSNYLSGIQKYIVGVLHAELLIKYGASNTTTAWVGAIYVSLMEIGAPLASALIGRFGCRACSILGSLCCFFGFASSAFTTTITQLFMTYGVLAGLGLALSYTPAMVAVNYNFQRLRSLAAGLACGSAAVGIISGPLICQNLLDFYGLDGTFLCVGAISLHHCVTGMLYRPSAFERRTQVESVPEEPPENEHQNSGSATLGSAMSPQDVSKGDRGSLSSLKRIDQGSRHGRTMADRDCQSLDPEDRVISHVREKVDLDNTSGYSSRSDVEGKKSFIGQDIDTSADDVSKELTSTNDGLARCGQSQERGFSQSVKQESVMRKLAARWRLSIHSYCVVLSNKAFVLHCGSLMLVSMQVGGSYLHLPKYAQTLGTSPNMAARLFIAAGIGSLVSRLGSGLMAADPAIDPLTVSVGMAGIAGLSTVLLPYYVEQFTGQAIFALLLGLYTGGFVTLANVLAVHFVGMTYLHTALGVSLFFNGAGTICGPVLAALVIDHGGQYSLSFTILGCLMLLACVVELLAAAVFSCSQSHVSGDVTVVKETV